MVDETRVRVRIGVIPWMFNAACCEKVDSSLLPKGAAADPAGTTRDSDETRDLAGIGYFYGQTVE